MFEENHLEELAQSLFYTFRFWEKLPHLEKIPHSILFASDISAFLLTFSGYPMEFLKRMKWFSAFEEERVTSESLILTDCCCVDLETELPTVIRIVGSYRDVVTEDRSKIFAEVLDRLCAFFELLGNLIMDEENQESRNKELRICIERIREYMKDNKKYIMLQK